MRKSGAAGGLFRGNDEVFGAIQRVADSGLIVLGHLFAVWAYSDTWRPAMTTATVIALVMYGFFAELNGLYRPRRSERLSAEAREVAATWLVVTPILFLLAFATKTSAYFSRAVSLGWFAASPALLVGARICLRLVLRNLRARGRNVRRVAILGATRGAEKLCAQILERPWLGMQLTGIYDDRSEARRHKFKHKVCEAGGRVDDLIRDARESKVDIVYIALPLRAEARIGEVLRSLADTTATVYMMTDFFTYDLLHARWTQMGDVPLVSIYDSPFHGAGGWLKRIEDVVVGTLICALIALPLLVISVLVKLTSKGPVFFRQRRYGLNGAEIRVLKFRTMTVCEDGAVVKQATKNDNRITPFGAFLRRTSLDELPQFLQVLTGEMSVVGPRPHAVAHNEQYRGLIHGYMLRHKVKPGITGWAQVNGWRGETDQLAKMEKRVEHDLEYIQNWNLLLDLKIIFLTIFGSKKNDNAF
jgi:putative colanic acid biosynthesis UDP-glucose lipid carrier transferase